MQIPDIQDLSAIIFNRKKNLQPKTASAAPSNNLTMLRLSLQIILCNEEPPLVSTPTATIPVGTASIRVALITSQILQVRNL